MKGNKWLIGIFCILFLLSLFVLSACSPKENVIKRDIFALGTWIEFQVYAPEEKAAFVDEALLMVQDIDNRMSARVDMSEISKINKNAGIGPVKVSEDTFAVIEKGLSYGKTTDGYFDILVGPLIRLWGFYDDVQHVPAEEKIKELLPLTDLDKIEIDPDTKEIFLTEKGMALDLGGIAKGYAADEIADYLKGKGIEKGILNFGGNLWVLGQKNQKEDWNIGIRHPAKEEITQIVSLPLSDGCAVTSGSYERYFEENGIRYSHILDPKTGKSVDNNVASVTVIGKNSADCDAVSTAVVLLGEEKGLRLLKELSMEGVIITNDKQIIATENIYKNIKVMDNSYRLVK